MPPSYVNFGSKRRLYRASGVHREKKEWGEEQWIVNREYCGKKLVLQKNRRCSLHKHEKKDEVFYILSGLVRMEISDKTFTLTPGDFVHIPAGAYHRFTGLEDSEIMEFSTNHQENDSYRKEYSGHVEGERFVRQRKIVEKFPQAKVLVAGDAMLDTYTIGDVTRISPEAPIPVAKFRSRRHVPGAAANAAANVASLGGCATLVSVRGKDGAGQALEALLKKSGVKTLFVIEENRATTEKHRIVASDAHQIVRVDYEDIHSLSSAAEKKIASFLRRELKKHDILLLSDYAKGFFRPEFLRSCIAAARSARVPVILDPKPTGRDYLSAARGVAAITPNRNEAQILAGTQERSPFGVAAAIARKLFTNVFCTLGGDGMLLASPKGKTRDFRAITKEVTDVSGAGDTVAATVALCLASGATMEDAADVSNRAAGVVVTKQGTATLTQNELLRVL
ncbi:cupin domain-containing protein [Candidatus Peregrinibacteria bacterium]|nr:cupin domain-containing protein [Candidatus Peregrinibacteria bacterium]